MTLARQTLTLIKITKIPAIEPVTRLFISHYEGKRTPEDAQELFKDIERRRSIASQFMFLHQTFGVL